MTSVRDHYDLVIIGGGINGAGIARDAAGRGLSVLLCEKNDLASATSSASSKLIHGGLRYLEHGEFSLVRKALVEREHLLHITPHLIKPLQFILPTNKQLRHPFLLRVGLLLYDYLSMKNSLPRSKAIHIKKSPEYFMPFNDTVSHAFSYYDCQVDDARLVIANALSAKALGADILTQTTFTSAQRGKKEWDLHLQSQTGKKINVRAHCVINAAGAWVNEVNHALDLSLTQKIQWVKGSHIVVSKQYSGTHAYILQHTDGRIIFVIPYLNDYSLIGTTDVNVHSPSEINSISQDELDYLCNTYNYYFKCNISSQDVLHHWSGVRTLATDQSTKASALSRDYKLSLDNSAAPAISIYGGKITTYRILAEETLELMKTHFSTLAPNWTHKKPLLGGDIDCIKQYEKQTQQNFPWLDKALLRRYISTYGTLLENILSGCQCMSDLGENFGDLVFSKEIDYLINKEWALNVDDILWRRTKLGLVLDKKNRELIEKYLINRNFV